MSKKNFGYTSVNNIKRRLGTWDSRKPGQSPKEMKALLEKTDKTLKNTKMGPERQGLNDRRYPTNYNSESMKFIRNHNAVAKHAYPNAIPESPNTKKSHKTNVLITKSATKVQDKVKIGPVTSALQDPDFNYDDHFRREPKRAPRLGSIDHPGLTNKQLLRMGGETAKKYAPEQVRRNVTYRTQGKQDLLEGKPRKTTVSAKAGAGMQMLKAQMRRFGAKQWWQSKTH